MIRWHSMDYFGTEFSHLLIFLNLQIVMEQKLLASILIQKQEFLLTAKFNEYQNGIYMLKFRSH